MSDATQAREMAPEGMMDQIRALAGRKSHRLGKDMTGTKPLTLASAQRVLAHLGKCADRQPLGGSTVQAPARTESAPRLPQGEVLPPLSEFTDIPKGFYATPCTTGSNDFDFWKVTKGKGGTKWEESSFVRRVLGGGSGTELRTEELTNIQQRRAFVAIREAGIGEAKDAFARELQHCKECGLPLTDEVSRAYGMGPTCRTKKG